MQRIFLSTDIVPDSDFLKELEYIRKELRGEHIKWVDFSRLHLTLKFIGETEEGQTDRIAQALSLCIAGREAFQLRLASLGVFKSLRHPQVIWIGCDKPEGLTGLKKAVDLVLEPLGILPEEREFSPHFTLGRIRHISSTIELANLIEHYQQLTFCQKEVDTLILYESILRPRGPEYIPLYTWELKTTSSTGKS